MENHKNKYSNGAQRSPRERHLERPHVVELGHPALQLIRRGLFQIFSGDTALGHTFYEVYAHRMISTRSKANGPAQSVILIA